MAASKGIAPTRPVDEQKAQLAKILPKKDALALQQDRLQELQDQLLERSLSIVDSSMRFADIDPTTTEPPQAWIDELGMDGAKVRLRVAQSAWAAAKDAPVGIKVASSVLVGILKAKATEKQGPRTLNVAVVHMTAPMPQFPEQEIEVGK